MRHPGPVLAPLVITLLVVIWGTTWAAIRISLEGFPPLTGVALRFAVASAVLLVFARAAGIPLGAAGRREWALRLGHGGLSFGISYGVVFWAEQWVPSGLAAVIFATFSLLVVVMARLLLPEIAPYIDILMLAADDWGTQAALIASSKVYRSLFLPYHRQMTDTMHTLAPQVKVFLHSCGAIYDLIDLVIEAGFDVLNPVQWCAGKHSFREWKDKARGRIALWGGGVNSQVTLPLGTVADVEREVAEVVAYLRQDSGYVFCNIHNILAEIAPEKVIAMYRTAAAV